MIEKIANPFNMNVFPLPLQVPDIHIQQVWHERNHHDPAHKWMRENIAQIFRSEE